jgi:hypothetical protein
MRRSKRQLSQGSVDGDGKVQVYLMVEKELTHLGTDSTASSTSMLIDIAH